MSNRTMRLLWTTSPRRMPLQNSWAVQSSLMMVAVVFGAQPKVAAAQEIRFDLPRGTSESHTQRVTLDEEPQTISAAKPQWIELRFHVAPGFHINSHTPHDDMLIATSLELARSPAYQVQQQLYPDGQPLELKIGAGQTLSTYTGDFRVRVQLVAAKGAGTLVGMLRYQACNAASCLPALDLPIRVSLAAR